MITKWIKQQSEKEQDYRVLTIYGIKTYMFSITLLFLPKLVIFCLARANSYVLFDAFWGNCLADFSIQSAQKSKTQPYPNYSNAKFPYQSGASIHCCY